MDNASNPDHARAPHVLDAEHRRLVGVSGTPGCYVAGEGPPLLLVHSINAAASAYELHTVFTHARRTRRVYALDLPGFGTAAREPRRYDIGLYVRTLLDTIDLIAAECGPAPFDAMALSLGCEFLAAAAAARPGRIRALALVSPTGFDARSARRAARTQDSLEVPGVHAVLSLPGLGAGLYRLLTTRRSVAYFMRRTYGSDAVTPDVIDVAWRNARVDGAHHAPLTFLSGRLFHANPRALYEALTQPVWVAQPTRGDFCDFSAAGWARQREDWRFSTFATGALPQLEAPAAFLAQWDDFLLTLSG
ncbi:MAG: alpha/beta hydrolase [Gammaproteobacteria bacterium]